MATRWNWTLPSDVHDVAAFGGNDAHVVAEHGSCGCAGSDEPDDPDPDPDPGPDPVGEDDDPTVQASVKERAAPDASAASGTWKEGKREAFMRDTFSNARAQESSPAGEERGPRPCQTMPPRDTLARPS